MSLISSEPPRSVIVLAEFIDGAALELDRLKERPALVLSFTKERSYVIL